MKRREFTHALAAGMLATAAAPRTFAAAAVAASDGRDAKLARIVRKIAPLANAAHPGENDMKAYLLSYFKDETHSIYFATSTDGYTFTDVNGGAPVLLGKDLAEQKGVRDPHLMRGPDNAFYLSMTDLHIYAQKEGLRATEWERPREQYGWGNNRSLILMKSYDLINWTHALVRVPDLFAAYQDIGAAWAPQTIFDTERKKLMVYFTVRHKGGHNHMVYAYADNDFTTLETTPKQLFTYPDKDKSTIDGDITKVGDKYHLFYVAHDTPGGLRHAVSDRINQGYQYDPRKVDPETVACEAPMLWRRIGSDRYILMYDVFGANPNNMGFSETTDFVNYKNLGRFNDPGSAMKATNFSGPKHASVTHITAEELARLQSHFAPKRT
ncbi:glycoside hydrolase family 43 protein [Pseudoduganella sp. LjRoot289]|uniref:glycoside hydrolase family 43 protein n=1 Tax=Pseudoduganella sp. LjRoot289 TaxID=3342314 RepID=UPI003ECEEECD